MPPPTPPRWQRTLGGRQWPWSSTSGALQSLAPDLARSFDDELELALLIIPGQWVAHQRGCKAALRAQRQLFQWHVARGLVDAAQQLVLRFQLCGFGRDQTKHHNLAARHEAQRLEATGPLA